LALRLRELNNSVRPQNNPPRLFIGSSQEDVAIAEEFRKELSQDGLLDVKIWKSSNDIRRRIAEIGAR
jgi:hypothetical protein